MTYIVDGSNLLGRMGADRHATEIKRMLAARLASFCRAQRARAICFFDGAPPDAFATSLGSVTIRFSKATPADDLIAAEVERAPRGSRVRVVTSDAALAARVARRNVEVIDAGMFRRTLESHASETSGDSNVDWEHYFSDPKNRNV